MKAILSIDGGGIRGLIPGLVLAELERHTGKPICDCFDLIAGTSTGGILAIGLTKPGADGTPRYSAEDLCKIYAERGDEIFSRSFWDGVTSLGGMTDEKYSEKGLERLLDEYFGDAQLHECLTNILISSYDIHERRPLFLKSWRAEHREVLMRHAARATSAAPTYFEPARIPVNGEKRALVDGGVFINSPSVSAYAEAKRIFPDETEFLLLSLGTGELTKRIDYHEAKDWGKAGWLVPLLGCVFDGVADAADYQMKLLLGDQYVRMQVSLTRASDVMDDASDKNIKDLQKEAAGLIERHEDTLKTLSSALRATPCA